MPEAHKKLKMNLATLRDIPSVHSLINDSSLERLKEDIGEGVLSGLIKKIVNSKRETLKNSSECNFVKDTFYEDILKEVKNEASYLPPRNRRAINATGIILHTGFGRAPLGESAKSSLDIASGYNLVQIDPLSNQRSLREEFLEMLMHELSGSESCTVVNNNAAASFLMLSALTKGKEVIVSRGHLVEIGGSYRMPDIMAESGCLMKEVGTTNKTHLRDYENAITENTGAILHVHQSNFRIQGFTSMPSLTEICEMARKHHTPVLSDLGSGAMVSMNEWGLPNELTVKEVINSGVEVCCFSGDKLAGGPQAGIICGKNEAIKKIRKSPYSRMFRTCKLTLRALEDILSSFVNNTFKNDIPVYRMLNQSPEDLEERAQKIINGISIPCEIKTVSSEAFLGGGSTPDEAIESRAISLDLKNRDQAKILSFFHFYPVHIFPRIHKNSMLFDLRTILKEEDEILKKALIESTDL